MTHFSKHLSLTVCRYNPQKIVRTREDEKQHEYPDVGRHMNPPYRTVSDVQALPALAPASPKQEERC